MPELASWRPVLPPEQAQVAVDMAREVAARLARPGAIEEAVASSRQQAAEPRSVYWLPHGLAQGDAGLALLYGQLETCFPGEGWDRLAHVALERGARSAAVASGGGLFSGLPGLAVTADFLSRGGRRYQKLLQTLDVEIGRQVEERLDALRPDELAARDWDLVSGLVGLGAAASRRRLPILERLRETLAELAAQTGPGAGFFVAAERIENPGMRVDAPEGHLDLGLAHGIAGPLGLLGLTRTGREHDAALERLAELLRQNRADDDWGPNWPAAAPARNGVLEPGPPTHAAWCYGAPGIARALWHAGYQAEALEAMRAVARRPPPARRLASSGLCHGFAGLLVHALRFWRDTGDPAMEALSGEMATRLLEEWEPDSLLGFRPTEPGGRRVDRAGLLEGAPGVALALLAAATDREPSWDRAFLLS